MNTSLFSWFYYEILENKLSTFFIPHHPEDHSPEENHFYTKEQVIEFEKTSNYPPSDDMDWDSEEAEEYLREREWRTYENYDDDYLEWFEDSFTTPSGETVVAFGQYGYDG